MTLIRPIVWKNANRSVARGFAQIQTGGGPNRRAISDVCPLMERSNPSVVVSVAVGVLLAVAADARAQTALSGGPLRINRTAGPIVVDGELNDVGWQGAERVETWYEINPGDNVTPMVRSLAYLAYDDRFFYAGFEFDDSNPRAIRAPYSDRDAISGNSTDYGGLILDTRNDGHSAVLLLVTPRGIQYDAVTDDASGEDQAPDFFWDSAARITDHGWTLEIRVPFSTLRYRDVNPQTWGVFLYRNYPRDFRYQIFSAPLPRGSNCFICRANTLVGLERLPTGGHVVAAPYVSGSSLARPTAGLGSPLVADPAKLRGGLDVKWTVNADTAFDATVKPDFSQIESDTAQISANERFALSYPEKRPFFLEGVELLKTPIQAVYTRAITVPRWGSRLTGKAAGVSYTTVIADDTGGGSVVIPGPNGSSFAAQDFGSYVFIGRARRDLGRSFAGVLVTDREARDGHGHNRVAGPDFQWRPSSNDAVTGQWLFSHTQTPTRPDLAPEWLGQSFASHAAQVDWTRNTRHLNLSLGYKDSGDGFRADAGFVPQVGFRETYHNGGWTVRPNGFLRRVTVSIDSARQLDRSAALISRNVTPSVEMDARWNGTLRLRFVDDRVRSGERIFGRRQVGYLVRFSPSNRVAEVSAEGTVGEEIDFANSRAGQGGTVSLNAQLNATDHLQLTLVQNQRWLDVDDSAGASGRLFTARVSRVRATYTFTARSFARVIGQYVSTSRDASRHTFPISSQSGTFSGSALLAYKLNWQSVLFVGYGDDRELSTERALEPASRQFFVKMSYAFQR